MHSSKARWPTRIQEYGEKRFPRSYDSLFVKHVEVAYYKNLIQILVSLLVLSAHCLVEPVYSALES